MFESSDLDALHKKNESRATNTDENLLVYFEGLPDANQQISNPFKIQIWLVILGVVDLGILGVALFFPQMLKSIFLAGEGRGMRILIPIAIIITAIGARVTLSLITLYEFYFKQERDLSSPNTDFMSGYKYNSQQNHRRFMLLISLSVGVLNSLLFWGLVFIRG